MGGGHALRHAVHEVFLPVLHHLLALDEELVLVVVGFALVPVRLDLAARGAADEVRRDDIEMAQLLGQLVDGTVDHPASLLRARRVDEGVSPDVEIHGEVLVTAQHGHLPVCGVVGRPFAPVTARRAAVATSGGAASRSAAVRCGGAASGGVAATVAERTPG